MIIRFQYRLLHRAWDMIAFQETKDADGQFPEIPGFAYRITLEKIPLLHTEGTGIPLAARIKKVEMGVLAKALIDGLIDADFLKPQAHATSVELQATKKHLEDMRALVWKEPRP